MAGNNQVQKMICFENIHYVFYLFIIDRNHNPNHDWLIFPQQWANLQPSSQYKMCKDDEIQ